MNPYYDNQHPNALKIQALINRMAAVNVTDRRLAANEIRFLNHAEVADLIHEIKACPGRRRARTAAWFATIIILVLLLGSSHEYDVPSPDGQLLALAAIIGALLAIKIYVIDRPLYSISAYVCLTLVNDMQVLGPLLRAYANRDKDPAIRYWVIGRRQLNEFLRAAVAALLRHLSKIDEDTAIRLSSQERRYLRNLLVDSNRLLVLAALAALQSFGDSRDLDVLSRLVAGYYAAWRNSAVHDAAVACKKAIESRVAEQTTIATLLRPSQLNSTSRTLLRPAAENPGIKPQELLRASHGETVER